ncbi:Crp/Fnr family transcriptional regulator [Candidatus Roizmanbacteria bacterium]|nr:Crp/Fnr family transcriptional regulator [Candidatus Roizmanbacteria bacterium]
MDRQIKAKIQAFFTKFPLKRYKKEEVLIDPNEELKGAFYLAKGFVREYTISPQGDELTLHVFAPGSYFPMTWVINGIKNRYYYEALMTCETHIASKEKVLGFFEKEPSVIFELSKRLLQGIDKFLVRIEYFASGTAKIRVISAVLFLARHFGVEKKNAIKLQYPFTHREIASFAGVSRETASREIERIRSQKLVEIRDHKLEIKNIDILKKQLL